MKKIGLVVGGGTGRELARVFQNAVETFSSVSRDSTAIVECPHEFCSFTELHGLSRDECLRIVERDVRGLAGFYRDLWRQGGRHVFRTAVNAETLYAVRRELECVKVSHVTIGQSRVSFFRDQFQGFYSNEWWHGDGDRITFQASFSKSALQRIYDFAQAETAAPEVWFVYKHHLFANHFVEWIAGICPRASVLQPGMAYSKLTGLADAGRRHVLLIAGNEIGDMLQEIFIGIAGGEHRETSCSRNVYLHPDVEGLAEYQTVHGSADDIAGLGRVNPIATLRAAAALFDEEFGAPGIAAAMDRAIALEQHAGARTEDRGRELVAQAMLLYREADSYREKMFSSSAASD